MSVTLINIFEVPAGDEDEFIAAWEKTRDYLKTFPRTSRLHCTSRCTTRSSAS
jgi:hypothetical protein